MWVPLLKGLICVMSVLAVHTASADNYRLPLRRCTTDSANSWPLVPTRSGTSTPLVGDVRVPIILTAYKDVAFTVDDVRQVWDDMANKHGYFDHGAQGCMADYFYEQSRGKFRITFDVIGPVTLPQNRFFYGERSDIRVNQMVKDACSLAAGLPDVDFSDYDWNGDGIVETVLVVYAGVGENVSGAPSESVWPKQGYVGGSINDSIRLSIYACANELVWPDFRQEGFGTLTHEFSHCFGLLDLYNTASFIDDYIIFDEWDLMDGGCYSADGWGPVGYSAYERMLCGWLEPEELKDVTDIDQLEALHDNGKAYKLCSDSTNEYLLLENRQHQSFDTYLPGHGLLVTHVGAYGSNPNYGINVAVYPIPADGLSYPLSFRKYVQDYYGVTLPDDSLNMTDKYSKYQYDEYGRSRLMAGTAFPYMEGETVVSDALSMFSKTVSNIRERDGQISFHFTNGPDAMTSLATAHRHSVAYYDLQGRQLAGLQKGICIVRYQDGSAKKVIR